MIRVITFDLDDTLWDVTPTLLRAEAAQNAWLAEHRSRVIEAFDAAEMRRLRMRTFELHPELKHHISNLRRQALYDIQLHCGYSEEVSRQGAEEAFEEFLRVRHQVQPYERALEVLERLSERYVLGALTNGNADIFKVDIGEYFDFAFSAEQIGASKPLPDMFQASMKESGARSHEMVHVGDHPEHDVAGAQAVGMHTVWANYNGAAWTGETPADEEVRDLAELPEAVSRIENRNAPR